MKLSTHVFSSPVGDLFVAVDEASALVQLAFAEGTSREEREEELTRRGHEVQSKKSACAEVERQVRDYFRGRRREFALELEPVGTKFQRRVWNEVAKIPFGRTASYGEIAKRVRHPTAVRAVGRCNATNPIVIVVPCHRVIGSNGSLTGYGGGIAAKRALLGLEGAALDARERTRSAAS
jgi:methylated-DNA-[protein]-cysteine S-methyltransferase